MDQQQKHKVKFPCNHPLRIVELRYAYNSQSRLVSRKHRCDGCGDVDGDGYYCSICNFGVHEYCIDLPEVINHPCHSRHPLKIVLTKTVDYTDGKCHFCRDELDVRMYHCSICNLSIGIECWIIQPPLTIDLPKSHNHTFTLMARKVSFNCNACGMPGDRNPYVCIECGFMLHKACIYLPRVIDINRHEHRITRTYDLSQGDWECGVCRKKMDWTFGAFSCKRCPNYAVHSKCATREDVWDKIELEDEPEEEEIEDPYKVISENEIIHFSHEHNLRLGDDDDNVRDFENMRCSACILPIEKTDLLFYTCTVQCKFFIHKVCANLPRMKRNIIHNHKLKLMVGYEAGVHFECSYCLQYFDGFSYNCGSYGYCPTSSNVSLDVRCSSIYEPFHHELHPHPLYRTSSEHRICGACGKESKYVLSCIVCEFSLGMECATLPRKVKHRCDDHVLTLHQGAGINSNGELWCDICEKKTDPSVWYYGCDECGVTLHIKCVIGDTFYLKPGNIYFKHELVGNSGMSRPFCSICQNRCMFPFILKGIAKSDSSIIYACSMDCADPWYHWRKQFLGRGTV